MNCPAEKVKRLSSRARTSIWHLMLPVIPRVLISPSTVDTVYHEDFPKQFVGHFRRRVVGSTRHDGHDSHDSQGAGAQGPMSMEMACRPQLTKNGFGIDGKIGR